MAHTSAYVTHQHTGGAWIHGLGGGNSSTRPAADWTTALADANAAWQPTACGGTPAPRATTHDAWANGLNPLFTLAIKHGLRVMETDYDRRELYVPSTAAQGLGVHVTGLDKGSAGRQHTVKAADLPGQQLPRQARAGLRADAVGQMCAAVPSPSVNGQAQSDGPPASRSTPPSGGEGCKRGAGHQWSVLPAAVLAALEAAYAAVEAEARARTAAVHHRTPDALFGGSCVGTAPGTAPAAPGRPARAAGGEFRRPVTYGPSACTRNLTEGTAGVERAEDEFGRNSSCGRLDCWEPAASGAIQVERHVQWVPASRSWFLGMLLPCVAHGHLCAAEPIPM
jgi:hypothetical protein